MPSFKWAGLAPCFSNRSHLSVSISSWFNPWCSPPVVPVAQTWSVFFYCFLKDSLPCTAHYFIVLQLAHIWGFLDRLNFLKLLKKVQTTRACFEWRWNCAPITMVAWVHGVLYRSVESGYMRWSQMEDVFFININSASMKIKPVLPFVLSISDIC